MDQFNFSCVPVPDKAAVIAGEHAQLQSSSCDGTQYGSADALKARANLELARYMPFPVAMQWMNTLLWMNTVNEFVLRPVKIRLKEDEVRKKLSTGLTRKVTN